MDGTDVDRDVPVERGFLKDFFIRHFPPGIHAALRDAYDVLLAPLGTGGKERQDEEQVCQSPSHLMRIRFIISTMPLKFMGMFLAFLSASASALRRSASSEGRV